jgi:nicotinamide mononucleotide transporter
METTLQMLFDQVKQTSPLEWVGFTATLGCIYLAAKENIWNWPVAILSVVVSAILYYNGGLFGDFYLQFYFLFTSCYGFYYWLRKENTAEKPIVKIAAQQWMQVFASIAVLTVLLGALLDRFTSSTVSYEDGFCTAMSFVAQLMLTRKILENWILWIIVDICYVPLLVYKEFYLYAVLYAILTILATQGYLSWRKTYREQAY